MAAPMMFWFTFITIIEVVYSSKYTPHPVLNSGLELLHKDMHSNNNKKYRALKLGDIFGPQELLPVTKRLMLKVDKFQGGKGIVTSAKSPEHLADKIFDSFFKARSRLVRLTALDLAGLDALQALALSGETISGLNAGNVPATQLDGQLKILRQRMACHYTLLRKREDGGSSVRSTKHQGQKKSIPKNYTNMHPQAEKHIKKVNDQISSELKENLEIQSRGTMPEKLHPLCRLKYTCIIQNDLDSCQLYTDCDNIYNDKTEADGDSSLLDDESTAEMKQFRKMIGLSVVDEEVEKIIERRLLKLNPELHDPEHAETLSEYFNNVIRVEQKANTPSIIADYRRSNDRTELTTIAMTEHQLENTPETSTGGKSVQSPTPKATPARPGNTAPRG